MTQPGAGPRRRGPAKAPTAPGPRRRQQSRWWLALTGVGDPRRRQGLMRLAVMAVLVVFAARLVELQVIDGAAKAAEGQANRMVTTVQPAERGQITTSDGTVLATDVARYEIQANPKVIGDKDAIGELIGPGPAKLAAELAPLIGADAATLEQDLAQADKTYVRLVAHATQEQWDQVSRLVEGYIQQGVDPGVYASKHYVRAYPAGTLAGNLIGYQYETEESKGAKKYTGLEDELGHQLAGKAGQTSTEVGGNQQPIPGGKVVLDPAEPGCDATLTIDSTLQFEAQRLIQAQVEKTNAQFGMVVAIDIPSGEILALADSETPDPSNPTGGTNSRALENIFEPGSTGKVVTMAMLLEGGYATPASQYTVPDHATVGGQSFVDSSGHETYRLTLAGVLAKSSNVGTVMAAQDVPDATRYDYLKRFGFGEETGVELPEATGVVHEPGVLPARDGDPYWDGRTRNTVLFGQGVSVNALQATSVFAILGNGGQRLRPHLLKGWTCAEGGFTPAAIEPAEPVVSEATATQLVAMLEAAVDSGTGKSAQVPGYRTAGKTGTSQMFDAGGQFYVGSFVGLLPAENPRVAIGVYIIDPKAEGYYGGTVAAPVFEQIAASAVDRLGVPPSTTDPAEMALEW
ncbi:MAG: penicillin-binding protein 2 [Bifidobacteriaceae bacterium]|nr:penicillin-binding protein 2 [Bifidobacteriaceae bacterium]